MLLKLETAINLLKLLILSESRLKPFFEAVLLLLNLVHLPLPALQLTSHLLETLLTRPSFPFGLKELKLLLLNDPFLFVDDR